MSGQLCNEGAFSQQASLDLMSKGHMLADVVAIIGKNMLKVQLFSHKQNQSLKVLWRSGVILYLTARTVTRSRFYTR